MLRRALWVRRRRSSSITAALAVRYRPSTRLRQAIQPSNSPWATHLSLARLDILPRVLQAQEATVGGMEHRRRALLPMDRPRRTTGPRTWQR